MNLAVCLLCILLVPFATAGLALIHQGLGRSRSAAHGFGPENGATPVSISYSITPTAYTSLRASPRFPPTYSGEI